MLVGFLSVSTWQDLLRPPLASAVSTFNMNNIFIFWIEFPESWDFYQKNAVSGFLNFFFTFFLVFFFCDFFRGFFFFDFFMITKILLYLNDHKVPWHKCISQKLITMKKKKKKIVVAAFKPYITIHIEKKIKILSIHFQFNCKNTVKWRMNN
jgi:hypothetical protein